VEQKTPFYDSVYRQKIIPNAGAIEDIRRRTLPVMEHAIGSVLDIGCGLGLAADMTGAEYHGIDFSPVAIAWAQENIRNPLATFEEGDFFDLDTSRQYDTVVLTEVLEHVEDIGRLADIAKRIARQRIIITVPADMEYIAHVKAKWSFDDIAELFGKPIVRGVIGHKWLLAVCDVDMPLVSVCMIVRNEEACLQRALDSTVGLADEVIVVDTGSEDNTLQIASDFGCRIYTGADRMDKAASRNAALNKARGEWAVILDADEMIEDPVGVREYLKTTDAHVLYIRLAYLATENDSRTVSFSQARAWRRGTMYFKYRAHELPVPSNGTPKLAQMVDFTWLHDSPSGRDDWKLQYTLDRLLLDVEENPGDPRPVYYLGRQYMYLKQYKEAVQMTQQYIRMGGGVDTADAWFNIARCYNEMSEPTHKNRLAALHQACAAAPERREFWGMLADAYWKMNRPDLAIGLMKTALSLEQPETGQVQHGWYSEKPHEILRRWENAVHDSKRDHIPDRAD